MVSHFINADLYELIKKNIPIVCVDLLIIKDGDVLLLRRKNPPARNQWWFPGGRIFKNETLFEAARRKGIDELSILLEPEKIISIEETIFNLQNDEIDIHTVNIVVKMKLADSISKICLDTNHVEFKWFDKIDESLHPAVKNPLDKINFNFS